MTTTSPAPDSFLAHPVGRWLLDRRGRMQRLDDRHPWLLDTAVAAAVLAFSLAQVLSEGDPAIRVAAAVLLLVPVWWRRKAPVLAFAAVVTVMVVESLAGVWVTTSVVVLVTLYGIASRSSMRALLGASAVTVVLLVYTVVFVAPVDEPRLMTLLLVFGTCTAAVAIGLAGRTSRAYLIALETDRERRARLAVAAERAGVAREMHDIVGHHVSIMIGLADGGATLAANRQEKAAEPLRLIAETGRQALDDLRRMLGVLRDDTHDATLVPQPGLADVERLLAGVRAAGLTVSYRSDGELRDLGPGVQLAVYRIVQEALTNTLKHAGAATKAEVSVAVAHSRVHVRVVDGGPAVRRRSLIPVAGNGIVGIRERAALYDGIVTAGPENGGWVVDVVLSARSAP